MILDQKSSSEAYATSLTRSGQSREKIGEMKGHLLIYTQLLSNFD